MTTQRSNSRHHNSAPAVIETLEERTLLSSIALNSDGQLAVTGSGIGERVAIFYSHSNTRVHAQIFVNDVLFAHKFYVQPDISSVFVRTLGGDDIVSNNTWITDIIWTGGGNDRVAAGYITSQVNGGDGDDVLDGRNGNDHLLGGNDSDYILGGVGNDRIHGNTGRDLLWGQEGDDVLFGDEAADQIYGHAGNDILYADAQYRNLNSPMYHYNKLHGGDGDDRIYDGLGYDEIFGDAGNDVIDATGGTSYFHPSKDLVYAGDGNDDVLFYSGTIFGGTGDDHIRTPSLAGSLNHDERFGIIYGGDGDDTLTGGMVYNLYYNANTRTGVDIIYGGNGDDWITADDLTADQIYAGDGDDYVLVNRYDSTPSQMDIIDLGEGNDHFRGLNILVQLDAGDGNDQIIIWGVGHNNVINLGAGDDVADTQGGSEIIDGGDGNDAIDSGLGVDQITGGLGDDYMIAEGADSTVDPGSGTDTWIINDVWHADDPNFDPSIPFDPNHWAIPGARDPYPTLFNDIEQGDYGNSYFWAALAAVANSGYDLASGIRYLGGNQFEVDLFDGAQWQAVAVEFDWQNATHNSGSAADGGTGDPRLYTSLPWVPSHELDSRWLSPVERDFWQLLYWRAWNQLFAGNEGGNPADVLENLIGKANLSINNSPSNGLAKQAILDALEEDRIVVVTTTDADVTGYRTNDTIGYPWFIEDHAYAVLLANDTYIRLYNPWHADTTNISDHEYHDIYHGDDGIIDIRWNEFAAYFATYSISGV